MDSESFFGFDIPLPPEDDLDIGSQSDEEYDALNDETFGNAAVTGDWEEKHEEFASFTEATKHHQKLLKHNSHPTMKFNDFQNTSINDRSLNEFKDAKELSGDFSLSQSFLSTLPIPESPSFSSILPKAELSGSPGNSIWTPSAKLDTLNQPRSTHILTKEQLQPSQSNQTLPSFNSIKLNKQQKTTLLNHPSVQPLAQPPGFLPQSQSLSSIKTVEEIEKDLRLQQLQSLQQIENKHKSRGALDDLQRQLQHIALQERPSPLQHTPAQYKLTSNLQPAIHHQHQHQQYPQQQAINPHQHNQQQLHHPSNFPRHPFVQKQQQFSNSPKNRNFPQNLNNHAGPLNNFFHTHRHLQPSDGPLKGFPHNRQPNAFNAPNIPLNAPNSPFQMPNAPNEFNAPNAFNGDNRHLQQNGIDARMFHQRNGERIMRHDMNRRDDRQQWTESRGGMGMGGEEREGGGREGNRTRRDSESEWEEWSLKRQQDEYSGLMTPGEKTWLRNIQAMQLQTENPYQEDYYYMMHSMKQERIREEESISVDGRKLLLPDRSKEGKDYEPPRLENSLGKLQVVTVNAPRKIIDLQVVYLDSSHPTTSIQRDMRKHRHLLLHIEKMYNIQIELDDLHRKIRSLPDCPTRDSFRSKCRQLLSSLWNSATSPHETFVQILCIRKGKTLMSRLCNWLGETEHEHILATIIQNISLISRKDATDQCLPRFWHCMDRLLANSTPFRLIDFAVMLTNQLQGTKTKSGGIPVLDSPLSFTVLVGVLCRGESLWQENLQQEPAWIAFLQQLLQVGAGRSPSAASLTKGPPVRLLPSVHHSDAMQRATTHLSRCPNVEPAQLKAAVEVLSALDTNHPNTDIAKNPM